MTNEEKEALTASFIAKGFKVTRCKPGRYVKPVKRGKAIAGPATSGRHALYGG